MSLVCGIDFETSGLNPETDRVIEAGACLWDWEAQVPLRIVSDLIDPGMDLGVDGPFRLTEEIEKITGITTDMLAKYGEYESDVLHRITAMAQFADYFVAHFGNQFDRLFFEKMVERHGDSTGVLQKKWLDTSCDVRWPKEITTRKLRYLASEVNFVNPFSHRAVFDVLTMLKAASCYRLEDIIARSQEPTVIIQAQVSYQENQKAKDFNFRWNPQQKIWWKEQKASDFAEEKDQYQFNISYLAERPVEEK